MNLLRSYVKKVISVSAESVPRLEKRKMSLTDLREIFQTSVESVLPQKLIKNHVKLRGCHLVIENVSYELRKPCYLVGFGKAVLNMATEIEGVLGEHLQMGIVNVPLGIFEKFARPDSSKIEYIEGAKNNLPDRAAMMGAEKIKRLVEGLKEEDLLIVLVSGGGSALLPLPVPPVTLNEKLELIRHLAGRGASIEELNSVRKQISSLKGGGLAVHAYPCRVLSLILSDIVGDPLGFIASGPTVPVSGEENAMEILKKYRLDKGIPTSIKEAVERGKERQGKNVPVVDGEYGHVRNFIIGNNKIAADSAEAAAKNKGYQSVVVSTSIEGDVEKLGKIYAKLARELAALISRTGNRNDFHDFLRAKLQKELRVEGGIVEEIMRMDFDEGICLVFAGEPTVVVKGGGLGGRNQQLALTVSMEFSKLNELNHKKLLEEVDIAFLSCGTDGMDGPTDAAGAISDVLESESPLKPEKYLKDNDCYRFYEKYNNGANLVKTGHTGTNVMDIHLLAVKPRRRHE